LIEPQVHGIPVVHQNFVDANAVAETRVQRQWRLIGNDRTVAGGRRVDVVQTQSCVAAAAATGGGARAAGADGATAERRRVPGKAAAVARNLATAVGATGAGAAGAVAAAPATGAVPAALDSRYAIRVRGVTVQAAVRVTRPHRPRYAVLMHIDDALLDGRQQPRRRRPLHRTARRSVRRRRRRSVPQALGGRRRTFVQA